ncbi:ninja-family protein AFP3-like [Glycine soja]|uniref:Ninja-family protein n=1 Tax=Glycine soja TaxID=3848 RepID=A0A0B2Q1Z6_GLYSO|nr:ninja-family protein AFP3-like [Glycine soja]KHN14039.1 Ninja-family protein AFP2 [Glycine soja]RZB98653.1 Ninja-family protein AFP2 [Glycine soja]
MAEVEDRDNNTRHHHHYISSTTTTQSPMNNFPRDLLRTFMGVNNNNNNNNNSNNNNHHNLPMPVVKLEEELELSLDLSMNGRFGVDPTAKKIKRTTSIPEFASDKEMGYATVGCTGSLVRTCSLPTETEEEWRKRKELQTLRRMEARRKRSEKQRNMKALREQQQRVVGVVGSQGSNPVDQGAGEYGEVAVAPPLARTVSLTTRVCGLGLNGDSEKEKKSGIVLPPPSPSQGSIGSSGISEAESQQGQGTTPMDVRSPTSANLLPDSELKSPAGVAENNTGKNAAAAVVTMRSQSNKHSPPQSRTKDIVRNLLEDMPCVSTKGEGPNGKRIEGFLYRYGKGEEVRIVCVCHGSFLTPSEFVKHAGGSDVANPLKHIVVSPSLL